MFVIEIIPIKKGSGHGTLSYFSSEKATPGSIIKVPLRGKVAHGIVIKSSPAELEKATLKSSPFLLRKVLEKSGHDSNAFFDEGWLKGVQNTAKYFATTDGSVMGALIPTVLLENIQKIFGIDISHTSEKSSKKSKNEKSSNQKKNNIKSEILCIQTDDNERWAYYRSAVREEFAKKHSIFLCLPTHEDVRMALSQFEKGIEKYTFVFHSGMNRLELVDRWSEALREEHPILIIGTAQWLLLPRRDLGTVILDHESSSAWRTLSRPYLDLRKVVELITKEKKVRLIYGDSVLRTETTWRYKNDEIFGFEPVKFRLNSSSQSELVSLEGRNRSKEGMFVALSSELGSLIKKAHKENKNIFIYATRRGLSSTTVCSDCGEEVLCHNCGSPVVLYKGEEVNIFRCHQCASVRSAKELCKRCGSWRLTPLGIGIERVKDEIEKAFPTLNIFEISKDTATGAKAVQTAAKFYKTPGSVLIGTEMALHYLSSPIDFTAVASIDSLFSVPDYKIREKIFHLILSLKLLAREKCLVQTRNVEKNTLNFALTGNLLDFYKAEIEDRELLGYPPFSVFIKITVRGEKNFVDKESAYLAGYFVKYKPVIFSSLSERREAKRAVNCILKVERASWPASEIINMINGLPAYYEVKVDPDNLL